MKILVTFAIENEFAPWRERRGFRCSQGGTALESAETWSAEIGGASVEVALTGAGPAPAGLTVSKVIDGRPDSLDFCISSGLAGALRPEYQQAQVLVARAVVAGDIETAGEASPVQSSEALVSFAVECGGTPVGTFRTAGRVIGRAAEKKYLGESADAVEMESFLIMAAARRRGIPAIAVRAVSDLAEEDLPFDMTGVFTKEGRISMPLVLAQVAKHPNSLGAVMKLGQNAKSGAEALSVFLERYIEKLIAAGAGLQGRTARTQ